MSKQLIIDRFYKKVIDSVYDMIFLHDLEGNILDVNRKSTTQMSYTTEFAVVAEEILSHHERWDSSGYPKKKKKKVIPYLARIISIIDAYDVMTSGRPYQSSVSKEAALTEIRDCAGSQFDPELAAKFVELLS